MKRIPDVAASPLTGPAIIESFAERMKFMIARDVHTATDFDTYAALAYAVRDQIVDRWFRTQSHYYEADSKRVYYLSLEFLLGRLLVQNTINLGADREYRDAMGELGLDLNSMSELEPEPGLGNGGLGRLAACFLDSAATLGLPFYGYGIRYEYGIFRQRIADGFQIESPDNWLRLGNPWEIPRPDVLFPVRFFGRASTYVDEAGRERFHLVDTEDVYAMAYDIPVIGYRNETVNTLRLWAAKSSREFDLELFNAGDYVHAVEEKTESENISKVLYPPDDKYAGKELRLKQQYFFVSATLQDVIRRFKKRKDRKWSELPDQVAIQLNDTHPAIAIPELMRVLLDDEMLEWDEAWPITEKVFSYTNHTILSEALETWSVEFFGRLLPRHLQIIEEIDRRFREKALAFFGSEATVDQIGIVDEQSQTVRMANLAIVGSHSVNGVARLHTEIIKSRIFPHFHAIYPDRFNNKTNGITPRRWLMKANPGLSTLIHEAIGDRWTRDLDALRDLEPYVEDSAFRERWRFVRRGNKERLARWIGNAELGTIDPEWLIDSQIKRIHEYKRQLLNILHAVSLYHRIEDGAQLVPRVILIGGKAAPAYVLAKLLIKLVSAVGDMVRENERVSKRLAVIFVPNFDVSTAEVIFPATDLSEQISTAGTEASGTGNMKASLNGGLIIGTMDGANIEIAEEIGAENLFVFGHTADQIHDLRNSGTSSQTWIDFSPELTRAIATIESGEIGQRYGDLFKPVVELLRRNDRYFHCADFESYLAVHSRAAENWLDQESWTRKSILSVARMGRFSGDRTVREYASEIWHVKGEVIGRDKSS